MPQQELGNLRYYKLECLRMLQSITISFKLLLSKATWNEGENIIMWHFVTFYEHFGV